GPAERPQRRGPSVVEALVAATGVERLIDGAGRGLGFAVRQAKHDPVVLRELKGSELTAVAPPQLRPDSQEERHVRAQPRGERAQGVESKGALERRVREAQGGRGVGASAAKAGRDRNALLDPRRPPRLDARSIA